MCYACLLKLHWPPEKFLSLPKPSKAYIAAAFEIKGKRDEEERKNFKVTPKRRR